MEMWFVQIVCSYLNTCAICACVRISVVQYLMLKSLSMHCIKVGKRGNLKASKAMVALWLFTISSSEFSIRPKELLPIASSKPQLFLPNCLTIDSAKAEHMLWCPLWYTTITILPKIKELYAVRTLGADTDCNWGAGLGCILHICLA